MTQPNFSPPLTSPPHSTIPHSASPPAYHTVQIAVPAQRANTLPPITAVMDTSVVDTTSDSDF